MIEASAASFELASTKLQYLNSNLNVCKPEGNLEVQRQNSMLCLCLSVLEQVNMKTTKQVAIVPEGSRNFRDVQKYFMCDGK